jgi:hypothetical protein
MILAWLVREIKMRTSTALHSINLPPATPPFVLLPSQLLLMGILPLLLFSFSDVYFASSLPKTRTGEMMREEWKKIQDKERGGLPPTEKILQEQIIPRKKSKKNMPPKDPVEDAERKKKPLLQARFPYEPTQPVYKIKPRKNLWQI